MIVSGEVNAAGSFALVTQTTEYYLRKGESRMWYWTMTPYNESTMFHLGDYGNSLSNYWLNVARDNVAPVINISSEYVLEFKGTGSISNPYYLEID